MKPSEFLTREAVAFCSAYAMVSLVLWLWGVNDDGATTYVAYLVLNIPACLAVFPLQLLLEFTPLSLLPDTWFPLPVLALITVGPTSYAQGALVLAIRQMFGELRTKYCFRQLAL